MKVDEVLYMLEGNGETSYAKNSKVQGDVMAKTTALVQEALALLLSTQTPTPRCIVAAELGCATGETALFVPHIFINTANEIYKKKEIPYKPQFQIFFNDLRGNDFNTLFRDTLPDFQDKYLLENGHPSCFLSGTPGSFYKRLFPDNSLHFVHCASSAHWLSQVPKALTSEDGEQLNKLNICYNPEESPPAVLEAFKQQFYSDFTSLLECRSKEMVPNGVMIITISGHQDDMSFHAPWMLLVDNMVFKSMVADGLIEKDKLAGFNMPFYSPSAAEIQSLVQKENSFSLFKLDCFNVWYPPKPEVDDRGRSEAFEERVKQTANNVRMGIESMFVSQCGETLMAEFFKRLVDVIRKHMQATDLECSYLSFALVKKA